MPKGNKPAARAIEWLCLIIGHLTLRNFKSMPESPFQIWSQWAENLTNCELLNEKPRLDGHPDGARGSSIGATEGAPNGFVSRGFRWNTHGFDDLSRVCPSCQLAWRLIIS